MKQTILSIASLAILLIGCAPSDNALHFEASPVSDEISSTEASPVPSQTSRGTVVAESEYGRIIALDSGAYSVELDEAPDPPERSETERLKAIEIIQTFWGASHLSLNYEGLQRHPENTGLVVETYTSATAQFLVDIQNNMVVFMQTNTVSEGISTTSTEPESLKEIVREFILARNPCFERSEAQLELEEGNKGSNYFFRWRSPQPNVDRPWNQPTFIQVGIHEEGTVFSYIDSGICYLESQ